MTDQEQSQVTLKTGKQAHRALVATVMLQLRMWMESGIKGVTIVYDLSKMARDPNYKPFGNNGKDILEAAFIDGVSGKLHRTIADIIEAATEGDGLEMRLVNPIAAELRKIAIGKVARSHALTRQSLMVEASEVDDLRRRLAASEAAVDSAMEQVAEAMPAQCELEREVESLKAQLAEAQANAAMWAERANAWDAERLALRSEVTRLRSRVRVERDDVVRADVTRAKCEAFVLRHRGEPLDPDVWPEDERTWPTAIVGIIGSLAYENANGRGYGPECWRILDEMARMPTDPSAG